ncbi:zeatin O-glucosyltransferase [Ziziphus jujuba]|uniref:Zeatin O-glucosyltransferase n=1 Tax=Ziziphus jujuba TaxID=326968 RepID=A0A6P4AJU8_ZIZJJ|nr:zeatin O-glucosyltransferase [Ziziphus jujuba]
MASEHQEQQQHQINNQDGGLTNEASNSVIVVMVPFPAQSHLNQLLQFSCLISSYNNIPVHFACFANHNSQVRNRAKDHLDPLFFSRIQFHDFPNPPPPNSDSPSDTPVFLKPSLQASVDLHQPVSALLHLLSSKSKRLVIIHDALVCSAVEDATSLPNAEAYAYQGGGAFTLFSYSWEFRGRPPLDVPEAEYIPDQLPTVEASVDSESTEFFKYQYRLMGSRDGYLYNTCRLIDGNFLDLIAKEANNKKVWGIGPLHLVKSISNSTDSNSSDKGKDILEWLDKQEKNSVLYISFGTTISMADQKQIEELAFGLEQSGTKFIWVFREADKDDAYVQGTGADLPQGFEDRVKGVGMVVRDFAPQIEIQKHSSTGGFMSHCGWNSVMESLSMGVPIAAWPTHTDQPRNAVLVTELLKVGVNVREWERKDELVSSSMVCNVVKKLMGSDEGDEMRKRAEKLGAAIRNSTAKGGVSCMEWDSFIAHITR